MKKKNSGFTLIEIMVVVVILGILAALIVPKIMSRPEQARVVKAKQDIVAIKTALNLYQMDVGSYPSTDQGLQALITKPSGVTNWKRGGYLQELPTDPWGKKYQYLEDGPGCHGSPEIICIPPKDDQNKDGIGAQISGCVE